MLTEEQSLGESWGRRLSPVAGAAQWPRAMSGCCGGDRQHQIRFYWSSVSLGKCATPHSPVICVVLQVDGELQGF
jgi:hypothetical protein